MKYLQGALVGLGASTFAFFTANSYSFQMIGVGAMAAGVFWVYSRTK